MPDCPAGYMRCAAGDHLIVVLRYGVWSDDTLTPTGTLREALVGVWEIRDAGGQAEIVHDAGDGHWHTITGRQVTLTAPPDLLPAAPLARWRSTCRPPAQEQGSLFTVPDLAASCVAPSGAGPGRARPRNAVRAGPGGVVAAPSQATASETSV